MGLVCEESTTERRRNAALCAALSRPGVGGPAALLPSQMGISRVGRSAAPSEEIDILPALSGVLAGAAVSANRRLGSKETGEVIKPLRQNSAIFAWEKSSRKT